MPWSPIMKSLMRTITVLLIVCTASIHSSTAETQIDRSRVRPVARQPASVNNSAQRQRYYCYTSIAVAREETAAIQAQATLEINKHSTTSSQLDYTVRLAPSDKSGTDL